MKYIILTIATILIFVFTYASLSRADVNDITYMGTVKAHQTITQRVNVQAGNTTIEVFNSFTPSKISCVFEDVNGKTSEQMNVDRCVGNIKNSIMPWHVLVSITNDGNKDIDFKIWAHETK